MKILIAIPTSPRLSPILKKRCHELASRLPDFNPEHELTIIHDYRKVEGLPSDSTPWSRVTRARQAFIESVDLTEFDYVLWIDADVVDYPADLPTQLVAANPTGIAAPLVFVEDWPGTPRFYDYAGFIEKGKSHIDPTNRKQLLGRNLSHDYPYWEFTPYARLMEMDCVGTIVGVARGLLEQHVFVDHPAFTDWFTLCERARNWGEKVIVDRNCVAWHANLGSGKYPGEKWHGE